MSYRCPPSIVRHRSHQSPKQPYVWQNNDALCTVSYLIKEVICYTSQTIRGNYAIVKLLTLDKVKYNEKYRLHYNVNNTQYTRFLKEPLIQNMIFEWMDFMRQKSNALFDHTFKPTKCTKTNMGRCAFLSNEQKRENNCISCTSTALTLTTTKAIIAVTILQYYECIC